MMCSMFGTVDKQKYKKTRNEMLRYYTWIDVLNISLHLLVFPAVSIVQPIALHISVKVRQIILASFDFFLFDSLDPFSFDIDLMSPS